MDNKACKKTCFIVTPIGNEGTPTRRHTDGVLEAVIKPLLESGKYNFEVSVAHEMHKTGSITNQVFESVVHSDLVIANVSGLNANVMYELGVRHAVGKHVITICEYGTDLPFDITSERSIYYHNDMQGALELKGRIEKMIDEIKFDEPVTDNPVINGLKMFELTKNLSEDDKIQSLLLNLINKVDRISPSNKLAITPVHNYFKVELEIKDFQDDVLGVVNTVLSIFEDDMYEVIKHEVINHDESDKDLMIMLKNNNLQTTREISDYINSTLRTLGVSVKSSRVQPSNSIN